MSLRRFNYGCPVYRSFINNLPISDTEDEDDLPDESSTVVIEAFHELGPCFETRNLATCMFSAAVLTKNPNRPSHGTFGQEKASLVDKKGVTISYTFENYEAALNEKLYNLASFILKNANFGPQEQYKKTFDRISPLSLALLSGHSIAIESVLNEFLYVFSIEQLLEANSILKNCFDKTSVNYISWSEKIKSRLYELGYIDESS